MTPAQFAARLNSRCTGNDEAPAADLENCGAEGDGHERAGGGAEENVESLIHS